MKHRLGFDRPALPFTGPGMAFDQDPRAALLAKLKSGQRCELSPDEQKIILDALERAGKVATDDPLPDLGRVDRSVLPAGEQTTSRRQATESGSPTGAVAEDDSVIDEAIAAWTDGDLLRYEELLKSATAEQRAEIRARQRRHNESMNAGPRRPGGLVEEGELGASHHVPVAQDALLALGIPTRVLTGWDGGSVPPHAKPLSKPTRDAAERLAAGLGIRID